MNSRTEHIPELESSHSITHLTLSTSATDDLPAVTGPHSPYDDNNNLEASQKLPMELMIKIFDHLPLIAVWKYRRVCKYWNSMLTAPDMRKIALMSWGRGNDTYSTVGYVEAVGASLEERERRFKQMRTGRPLAYTHIPGISLPWHYRSQEVDEDLPTSAQLQGHYLAYRNQNHVVLRNLVTGASQVLFERIGFRALAFCLTDRLIAVLASHMPGGVSLLVLELEHLGLEPRRVPIQGWVYKLSAHKDVVIWATRQGPERLADICLYDITLEKQMHLPENQTTTIPLHRNTKWFRPLHRPNQHNSLIISPPSGSSATTIASPEPRGLANRDSDAGAIESARVWPTALFLGHGQVKINATKRLITFFSCQGFRGGAKKRGDNFRAIYLELVQFTFAGTLTGRKLMLVPLGKAPERNAKSYSNTTLRIAVEGMDQNDVYSILVTDDDLTYDFDCRIVVDVSDITHPQLVNVTAGKLLYRDTVFNHTVWNDLCFQANNTSGFNAGTYCDVLREMETSDERGQYKVSRKFHLVDKAGYPPLIAMDDAPGTGAVPIAVNDSFLLFSTERSLTVYSFDSFGESFVDRPGNDAKLTIVRSLMQPADSMVGP